MKIESALIIAVPEAEPLVKEWRERFDYSAGVGVPAHITLLYPFMPPGEITPAVAAELRAFCAQFAAFEFTLPELRRFPAVLYLAPSPAEPFKALTHALVERYPGYPPYGGGYSEVIPHLTIADVDEAGQLDDYRTRVHESARRAVASEYQGQQSAVDREYVGAMGNAASI